MFVTRIQGFAQFADGLGLVSGRAVGGVEVEGHGLNVGRRRRVVKYMRTPLPFDKKVPSEAYIMPMYIPTQTERYSKRSLLTLILCVMSPSGVYAYLLADKMPMPVDSILGLLNIFLFFTYPLAFVFAKISLPWVGSVIASLLVHGGAIALIYTRKEWTAKRMISLAISIGMADLLVLKAINSIGTVAGS